VAAFLSEDSLSTEDFSAKNTKEKSETVPGSLEEH
jgi:hypothetical protein